METDERIEMSLMERVADPLDTKFYSVSCFQTGDSTMHPFEEQLSADSFEANYQEKIVVSN